MASISKLISESTESLIVSQIFYKFTFNILTKNVTLIINSKFMQNCILLNGFDNFQSTIASDEIGFNIDCEKLQSKLQKKITV